MAKTIVNVSDSMLLLEAGRFKLFPYGTVINKVSRDRKQVSDEFALRDDVRRMETAKKLKVLGTEELAKFKENEANSGPQKPKKSAHKSGDGYSAVPPPKDKKASRDKAAPGENSALDAKKAEDREKSEAKDSRTKKSEKKKDDSKK